MKTKFFSVLFAVAIASVMFTGCKKEGCTDPLAENYDIDAKTDDGTCTYPTVFTITDDGSGVGTTTWESGKTYILEGFVFVNDGQTLTIEPGAVIKGTPGSGTNAAALIVARGGKIMAQGTADNPIIFTALEDDVEDPNDIPVGQRGLWGGVIILGKASLNSTPGESAIEGIPTTETRGIYGGTEDADNSGVFSYVSIRYGGSDIGSGNEINGLSMGGVGSGTTIDHVEVIYNKDDGFEWFGGTVNAKYLVSAFCGDDAFDYDEGWRGKGQFWVVLQAETDGDRGGEHDGGTNPEDGTPYATPNIWNATYIGRGEAEGKRTITFRDNAGGQYHNSIFVDFGKGIDIELLASGEHSYSRYTSGDLALENNVFWNVAGNTAADIFQISVGTGVAAQDSTNAADDVADGFGTNGNTVADPGVSIARTPDGSLNLIPSNTMTATPPADSWFEAAAYKGAFGSTNWMSGWTFLDGQGYF